MSEHVVPRKPAAKAAERADPRQHNPGGCGGSLWWPKHFRMSARWLVSEGTRGISRSAPRRPRCHVGSASRARTAPDSKYNPATGTYPNLLKEPDGACGSTSLEFCWTNGRWPTGVGTGRNPRRVSVRNRAGVPDGACRGKMGRLRPPYQGAYRPDTPKRSGPHPH